MESQPTENEEQPIADPVVEPVVDPVVDPVVEPVADPEPPKEGYALFTEKFFQIRRAAFQTGWIAGNDQIPFSPFFLLLLPSSSSVIAHFLVAFMVVVGLYQITIASMYFGECPANDFVPQFLIMLGCVCILDMVFSVLAIIPMEISTVFFYSLMLIRLVIIGLLFYGFRLLRDIQDRERTHFCVDILADTLKVTLILFSALMTIYYVLLIFNVVTAVALMHLKKS